MCLISVIQPCLFFSCFWSITISYWRIVLSAIFSQHSVSLFSPASSIGPLDTCKEECDQGRGYIFPIIFIRNNGSNLACFISGVDVPILVNTNTRNTLKVLMTPVWSLSKTYSCTPWPYELYDNKLVTAKKKRNERETDRQIDRQTDRQNRQTDR